MQSKTIGNKYKSSSAPLTSICLINLHVTLQQQSQGYKSTNSAIYEHLTSKLEWQLAMTIAFFPTAACFSNMRIFFLPQF